MCCTVTVIVLPLNRCRVDHITPNNDGALSVVQSEYVREVFTGPEEPTSCLWARRSRDTLMAALLVRCPGGRLMGRESQHKLFGKPGYVA